MKHKPVLAALLCFFAITSQAQVTTYDIGTYKLPDVTWQALETTFGLSGNNGFQNNYSFSPSESNSNLFSGNLNINYWHFRNSESLQRYVSAGASSNFQMQNSSRNEITTLRSRALNPMLYFNSDNRFYFRHPLFYEINLRVNYGHNYSKRETNLADQIRQSDNYFTIAVPLKFGYGRIEPVQDARQAIYILDELSRVGRVTGNKTDDDIVELANQISRLRNKRFLDSRLGWMEQIESIDSLLLANDFITQQDARYFTTLADMWNYGNYPSRSSGNRISFAVYPQYILNDNNGTSEGNDYEYQINRYQLNTGIEFVHEKPLNLFWQNSLSAHAYYTYLSRQGTNEPDSRTPGMELNLAHKIGFYPNTRTEMTFSNGLTYDNNNYKVGENQSKINNLIFDSSLRINYYFSPQLRISGNSNISYNRNKHSFSGFDLGVTNENRGLSHSFNIEVIYKIF